MAEGADVSEGSEEEGANAYGPASRRTHFAEERTLLAWWRSGMAAAAVALAVGGIAPKLSGVPSGRFHALGAGYGLLAIFFVVGGSVRDHLARRALARGEFSALSPAVVVAATVYFTVLIVLTVIALF